VVAQLAWSCFNLKTTCAKGRSFVSSFGRLIQRKFSPTTTTISKIMRPKPWPCKIKKFMKTEWVERTATFLYFAGPWFRAHNFRNGSRSGRKLSWTFNYSSSSLSLITPFQWGNLETKFSGAKISLYPENGVSRENLKKKFLSLKIRSPNYASGTVW
jgi:hypothetical protein